jgi:hypothetical protein
MPYNLGSLPAAARLCIIMQTIDVYAAPPVRIEALLATMPPWIRPLNLPIASFFQRIVEWAVKRRGCIGTFPWFIGTHALCVRAGIDKPDILHQFMNIGEFRRYTDLASPT